MLIICIHILQISVTEHQYAKQNQDPDQDHSQSNVTRVYIMADPGPAPHPPTTIFFAHISAPRIG